MSNLNTNFPSHRLSKNSISTLSQKDRVILLEGPPVGSSYKPREGRKRGEEEREKRKRKEKREAEDEYEFQE